MQENYITREEFNEKYKEYLEPGFSGLDFDIPRINAFLDKLFEQYLLLCKTNNKTFQYSQIKFDLGFAKVYTNMGREYDNSTAMVLDTMYEIHKKTNHESTNSTTETQSSNSESAGTD